MNRREALGLITVAAGLPIGNAFGAAQSQGLPNFSPAHLFKPSPIWGIGDGKTLDSRAINAAIDACNRSGGGVVYCSPGRYLCGTVELRSNVTLYIEAGAVILGSTDVAQYTLKPGPDPSADAGQGHLIYARDVENVGIVGGGKIDGQGHLFGLGRIESRCPKAASGQTLDTSTGSRRRESLQ